MNAKRRKSCSKPGLNFWVFMKLLIKKRIQKKKSNSNPNKITEDVLTMIKQDSPTTLTMIKQLVYFQY